MAKPSAHVNKHETYELKRILPRHQEILRLCLLGVDQTDIATQLDMSNRTISLIVNSPLFQSELSRRRKNIEAREDDVLVRGIERAREILDDASATAAQEQVDLLGEDDPRIRHSAAKDILDRTIGSKVDGSKAIGIVIDDAAMKVLKSSYEQVKDELKTSPESVLEGGTPSG